MDDHNTHHVNPLGGGGGGDDGEVYDECDNIIQVLTDMNIAIFLVVIPYSLVGV